MDTEFVLADFLDRYRVVLVSIANNIPNLHIFKPDDYVDPRVSARFYDRAINVFRNRYVSWSEYFGFDTIHQGTSSTGIKLGFSPVAKIAYDVGYIAAVERYNARLQRTIDDARFFRTYVRRQN